MPNEKIDSETGEITPARAPKTFLQTLQEIGYGEVAEEATEHLVAALAASERLGKVSSVTVKLSFKPSKKGQVEVYPQVTSSVPKEELGVSIMFMGENGLQRQDPRQKELEGLRAVEREERAAPRATEADEPRTLRTV